MAQLDPLKQAIRDVAFRDFQLGGNPLGTESDNRIVMIEPIGQLALRVTVENFPGGPQRQFVVSVQETGALGQALK